MMFMITLQQLVESEDERQLFGLGVVPITLN